MGLRIFLAGNLWENAEIMHFGNGLPRQSVPQGHLLRGADWLAMTDFFDSLRRRPAGRRLFLHICAYSAVPRQRIQPLIVQNIHLPVLVDVSQPQEVARQQAVPRRVSTVAEPLGILPQRKIVI